MEEATPKQPATKRWLAVALILGFALGVPVGILAPRLWPADKGGLIVQRGVVTEAAGLGEYAVFYPRPFAAPPNLTMANQAKTGHAVKFVDQRADGFRILFVAWNSGAGEKPAYEARGVLSKSLAE